MNRFPRKPQVIDGYEFASMKEAKRYGQLVFLQKAGEITDIEPHPTYEMEIGGAHFCKYTPDFRYRTKAGELVIEEVKSSGTRRDPAYRLRKKACELFHGLSVTEIRM